MQDSEFGITGNATKKIGCKRQTKTLTVPISYWFKI
jgi:hypothetical protein